MARRILITGILLAAVCLTGGAPASVQTDAAPAVVEAGAAVPLRRFSSAAEFEAWREALHERRRSIAENGISPLVGVAQDGVPQNETGSMEVVQDEEFELSGAVNVEQVINNLPQVFADNPAITNNQTVGVDEGGIVKQIGRFLIVLRDGRLFSVDLGEAEGAPLRLASRIDVYRSRATAADWYDEMLVFGNRILVTAYNYDERASEIGLFTLDGAGRISREGRWLISSDDYYSTENYATRLVGENLVFYAPHALMNGSGAAPMQWPRLRRAPPAGAPDAGTALIGPTEVYAPVGEIAWPVLHTLSICPLRGTADCRTTAFVGGASNEVYVSPTDAFLWLDAPDGLPWSIDYANMRRRECPSGEEADSPDGADAMLYRLPLDGGRVAALSLEGVPENQFAFDSSGERFRALLAMPDGECRKWDASDRLALLDIPLSAFGEEVRRVSRSAYTPLPSIEGGLLENRFIGDWLLYGGRSNWTGLPRELDVAEGERAAALWAVPLARPAAPVRIALPHNALRIERAGPDAVVTGYRGADGLSMSYVALGGEPRLVSTTLLPGRYESEGRSHAFGAWMRRDGSGLIGIPTERRQRAGRGWSESRSSNLSYVAVSAGKSLVPAGELRPAARRVGTSYRCLVSCVNWYGNSRPIFTGGRIFALMGPDLVEGRMRNGLIAEAGRVDLTAPVRTSAR